MEMTEQNFKEILSQNEIIGRYVGAEPETEWSVVSGPNSIRYSPSHMKARFPTPDAQKKECERYIKEQEDKKYSNPGELMPMMFENWPQYNQCCRDMMSAILKITARDTATFDMNISSESAMVMLQETGGYKVLRSTQFQKDLQLEVYTILVAYVRYMSVKQGGKNTGK